MQASSSNSLYLSMMPMCVGPPAFTGDAIGHTTGAVPITCGVNGCWPVGQDYCTTLCRTGYRPSALLSRREGVSSGLAWPRAPSRPASFASTETAQQRPKVIIRSPLLYQNAIAGAGGVPCRGAASGASSCMHLSAGQDRADGTSKTGIVTQPPDHLCSIYCLRAACCAA